MANPFLVLGGIAVGIVTAGFGILQVPGWISSAQDASAKNDIAQVSIGQAASLSTTGFAKSTVAAINADDKVGVTVTTQNTPAIYPNTATNAKSYIIVVTSASGKIFARQDGGVTKVIASASFPATPTYLNLAPVVAAALAG